MKFRTFGAVLATAAALCMAASPAMADNYPVKDGSGALQTFASKVVGFIHHPLHVMEGLFGGAPTPVNMTNPGALDVTVVGGAAGGTTVKANASDQTYGEGSTTGQLSVDLNGYLRVLTKQSGVWNVSLATGSNVIGGVTQSGAWNVGLTGAIPAGSNVIGAVTQSGGPWTVTFPSTPAVKIQDSGGGDATDVINHAIKVNVVAGGASASISAFAPTGNATLAVTTASARVAFASADNSAIIQNTGTATAFFKTGSGTVTAATTDTPILPGQAMGIATGGNADIAAITSAGSTTLTITTGTGFPALALAVDASKASPVVGSTASGSTLTDPPVAVGCRASSTAPTAVSDGQVVAQRCGLKGGAVEHPFTIRELASRSSLVTVSSTTETTLMAAGGAGVFLDMASIKLCNTSATAVRADIRDATGGNVQDTWYLPAGQCEGATYTTPLKQTTAANNWTIQLSGAVTDVRTVAQFVQP